MGDWNDVIVPPDEIPASLFQADMPAWLQKALHAAWRDAASLSEDSWPVQEGIVSLVRSPAFAKAVNKLVKLDPAAEARILEAIKCAPRLKRHSKMYNNKRNINKIESYQRTIADRLESIATLINADFNSGSAANRVANNSKKYLLTKSELNKVQFGSNALLDVNPDLIYVGPPAKVTVKDEDIVITPSRLFRLAVDPYTLATLMNTTARAIRETIKIRQQEREFGGGAVFPYSVDGKREKDTDRFIHRTIYECVAGDIQPAQNLAIRELHNDITLYIAGAVLNRKASESLHDKHKSYLRDVMHKARKKSVAKRLKNRV